MRFQPVCCTQGQREEKECAAKTIGVRIYIIEDGTVGKRGTGSAGSEQRARRMKVLRKDMKAVVEPMQKRELKRFVVKNRELVE